MNAPITKPIPSNLRLLHLAVSFLGIFVFVFALSRYYNSPQMPARFLNELVMTLYVWTFSFGLLLACSEPNATWFLDNYRTMVGRGALGGLIISVWACSLSLIGTPLTYVLLYLATGAFVGALVFLPIGLINMTITHFYNRSTHERDANEGGGVTPSVE